MKGLLLAAAALGFAGTIGTANAVDIPLTATSLDIWSQLTTGDDENSLRQQALPGTRSLLSLLTLAPATPPKGAAGSIFLNATANTVGNFLGSGIPTPVTFTVPASCDATCLGTQLSLSSFGRASLFEFGFTIGTGGTLSIDHDDGISLFRDLGGGNNPDFGVCSPASCPNDLFPVGASHPTNVATSGPITLGPGSYDLFYESNNNLPEVLQTHFNAVPAPLIGHGLLVLLAVGGVLFGGKLLESHKKHAA
jgi:hypothetical protein